GDPQYGIDIGPFSGRGFSNDILQPGQIIQLPHYVPLRKGLDNSIRYQEFIKLIIKNLAPVLEMPEQKVGFLEIVFMVAAVVIGIAVASLGAAQAVVMSFLGITSATKAAILIGATIGALADAVGQGLLVGFNIKKEFSLSQ